MHIGGPHTLESFSAIPPFSMFPTHLLITSGARVLTPYIWRPIGAVHSLKRGLRVQFPNSWAERERTAIYFVNRSTTWARCHGVNVVSLNVPFSALLTSAFVGVFVTGLTAFVLTCLTGKNLLRTKLHGYLLPDLTDSKSGLSLICPLLANYTPSGRRVCCRQLEL